MRWVIIVGFVGCFVGFMHLVSAGDYEIRPKYQDFTPNDGFMDAGSPSNPYVVIPPGGQPSAEVRTQFQDFTPHDGFMDAGSYSNPYVYRTND